MFKFDITQSLRKKISKLNRKDKVLVNIFKKKVKEIITRDINSINIYKNLRNPLHNYKRIHLDDKFILLFQVDMKNKFILFVDIRHYDKAYK